MINQNDLISYNNIDAYRALPFSNAFTIQEFTDNTWEVSCYLLSIKKSEGTSDNEGYLLLKERLIYFENNWKWEEAYVKLNRNQEMKDQVDNIIKNGSFKEASNKEVLDRLKQLNIHLNYERIINKDSKNLVIFDEWNLFETFGRDNEEYFLFVWYTTA